MFDVVVIGGNLAGVTAAINAASKGVSVVLVERNKEPFDPAHCGELVSDNIAELLNLDKIGCYKNKINKMIVNVPPREYIFKFKKKGMTIFDRNCVEKKLLKKAEKEGVELMLGITMREFKPPHKIFLDNDKMIKGRIIIDASGIACQVGRRIGIDTKLRPEDIGVCIQSRVRSNFDANTTKSWLHNPYAPFGYAWIFPFNEKIANIGIIVPGGQKLDLAKLLKNYIEDVTEGRYKITNTFIACVPTAPPLSKLIKGNVMIVGDAARLVYPESGGGIENALFSGRLAGMTAAKYILREISSLEAYQHAMRIKILRIKRGYNRKVRASESDEKFLRTYRDILSIFCFINKLFPNFSHIPGLTKLERL